MVVSGSMVRGLITITLALASAGPTTQNPELSRVGLLEVGRGLLEVPRCWKTENWFGVVGGWSGVVGGWLGVVGGLAGWLLQAG